MSHSKFHNFNFDFKIYFYHFLVFVCKRKSSKNDYRKRKDLVVTILATKIIKFGVKIFHSTRSI